MKNVVINNCFGGFSLSAAGVYKYAELAGINVFGYIDAKGSGLSGPYKRLTKHETINETDKWFLIYWLQEDLGELITKEQLNAAKWFHDRDIERDDMNLVNTVKILKGSADGRCAKLAIIEVPEDAEWHIEEYDGNEHVAENHRTWG